MIYGPLGDRWGKYRVVMITTLGCSVGAVLSAMSQDLDQLVVARILTAVSSAAIVPLALAWVGDQVPYAQRQETLARVGLGTTSGGARDMVPVLARAGVAVGVAGLFMETHPKPADAWSDGPNAVPLGKMRALLETLVQLDAVTKKNPFLEDDFS